MRERTITAPQTQQAAAFERYVFLDGLRGWGAVAVLVFHYLVQVFPPSTAAASILQRVIFFNGTIAVWMFFVVSGFSLSIGYIRRKDSRVLTRLAIGRYPRLAIPILAACGLVHVMMVTGLIYPPSERPDALKPFLNFESSLAYLFRFSLFDVFFDHRLFESYIPPLWTMSVELIGSGIVIALLAGFGRVKWRLWAYVGTMIVLMAAASLYGLFVAGIILAELYVFGLPAARWIRSLLVIGFVAGALVPVFSSNGVSVPGLLGVAGWCAAWTFLAPLRRLLQVRISRWLGTISFPLYLVHAPLLYSLCLFLQRTIQNSGIAQPTANLIVVTISIPAAILAAWVFTPINEFAVAFSRWLGRTVVEAFVPAPPATDQVASL
jgi:peptidoglycan/LPS O-acetylase OafA/YrhL